MAAGDTFTAHVCIHQEQENLVIAMKGIQEAAHLIGVERHRKRHVPP
jgi:hypothetical protein